jgi:putative ABC transport system permease protein
MINPLQKFLKRTPVAWLQTTNNPTKLLIGVAGVSFSNLLMFFQLGLMDSLYNSQRKPIDHFQADLVMVNSKYSNLGALQEFQRSQLYQVLGVSGVESVAPLRISRGNWITPETRQSYDVSVFGVDLEQPSLDFPEIEQNRSKLRILRNALFDRNSKKQYGNIQKVVNEDGKALLEISGKQIRIIDTFNMGATFAAEANLITSDNTYLYLFPKADARKIQVGLIKLKPGANPQLVQNTIRSFISKDVRIETREGLSKLEVAYWRRNSSVGFIFSLGVLVGFIVGSIIVYQILFGDVMNSLPQYATLKAMGYRDSYVISIVIQQSALLALVGFVPGVLLSMGLYSLLATVTKLTVIMTTTRALQVLALTFVMCVGSGTLATRKLVQLDPADVF